jgi:4-amino-4-deoxy-L-arabinose transferase-like glycosyltransferase
LLFLCFEPSILQWHSSFWSESIFLTLLIIVFTLLIKKSESITINFLIGFLLGLMYLQKAYSFLFIIPIIIFFLLVYKKKILSLVTLILGYILIMLFIGFNHLQKQDSFYLLSSKHEYYSYYHYFAAGIYADRKNIDPKLAKIKIDNFEKKWRQENNIEIIYPIENTDKKDLDKNLEYRNNFFLNEVKQNPIYFFKLLIKKTIVMCILHPTWVYENYMLDKGSKEANENPKEYFHKSMNRNIFYSLIIYFFVLVGLKDFFLKLYKNRSFEFFDKFLIFNILSILYFISIAGLWGQPRYFAPCLINLSFFFAYGANNILSRFKK